MRKAAILLFVWLVLSPQGLAQDEGMAPPSNLSEAISRGDAKSVERFLADGVDPNIPDEQGAVPLLLAIQGGHVEVVEALLTSKGLNVDVMNEYRQSALELAILFGEEGIAVALIDNGARVHKGALHEAAMEGMATLCGKIIERMPEELDRDNRWGQTPLQLAILGGHVAALRVLLEAGADGSLRDGEGRNARDLALEVGVDELVGLFGGYGTGWPFLDAIVAGEYETVKAELEADSEQIHLKGADGRGSLHYAVLSGGDDLLRLLLDHDADRDQRDGLGRTALHDAARLGRLSMAQSLLEAGAEANSVDRAGWTPLHTAAHEGQLGVVNVLLSRGANLHARIQGGHTALHMAAMGGSEEIAKRLLSLGVDVNSPGENQATALHLAVIEGHNDLVRFLLENGADVNAVDGSERTALHHTALPPGNFEAARLLVEHGANPQLKDENRSTALDYTFAYLGWGEIEAVREYLVAQSEAASLNSTGTSGRTLLQSAIHIGLAGLVEELIAKGVDVNMPGVTGELALGKAVEQGRRDFIEMLLDAGAEVRPEAAREAFRSYATVEGLPLSEQSMGIINLLVSRGAEPVGDDIWNEAFSAAVSSGQLEVAEYLITQGIDVNARVCDEGTDTPLEWAIWNKQINMVKLLIEHGAEVNTPVEDREITPLLFAVGCNNYEICRLLVNCGADVNLANFYGAPLHVAASIGNERLVEFLLDHGAAINARAEKDQDIALHSAVRRCDEFQSRLGLVELLVKRGADLTARDDEGMTPLGAVLERKKFYDTRVEEILERAKVERGMSDEELRALQGNLGETKISEELSRLADYLRAQGAVE